MSEISFQSVPVPDRFVLRVMSCITEWSTEELTDAGPPESASTDRDLSAEGTVWPANDLKALSRDLTRKTPQIITKMLDFLATTPGRAYRSDTIGRNIDVPAESVSAALRKLTGYFESRLGRTDRPFTQADGAYSVTPAQARAWTEARRSAG
jgi:hypothetical protein